MKTFIKTFLNDESGASAAEYALILAVVGVAIGAGALVLGENIGVAINNAGDSVGACANAAADTTPPVLGATATEGGILGSEC